MYVLEQHVLTTIRSPSASLDLYHDATAPVGQGLLIIIIIIIIIFINCKWVDTRWQWLIPGGSGY
jgi:hypothetical protein